MYKDQKEKISYYRSRVIQDLVRKGIYPDDSIIQDRVDNIDSMLAILQYMSVKEGDTVDVRKINEDLLRVYQDLVILYKLAYEISIKQYEELRLYCEAYIDQLQNMTEKYKYQTQLESSPTYIGETIYYQSSGYKITKNNDMITIDLGTIKIEPQSKLFFIFKCDEIDQENIIFRLIDNTTKKEYNCSSYDYRQDYFTVPGTLKKDIYTYKVNGKVRSSFICTPEDLTGNVSTDHKYKLYGARDYVSLGYTVKTFVKKYQGVPIEFTGPDICSFWILNGTYANFSFSQEPDSKSFKGYEITGFPDHYKVTIEHSKPFYFNFVTDGSIYATYHEGKVQDGNIIYPALEKIDDILIEDYSVGNKENYSLSVTGGPVPGGEVPIIKYIAVKQLSSLEGVK